jgi:hypothetical protein
MKALLIKAVIILLSSGLSLPGHDVITTKITWNREIIRIVSARCLGCHKEGGKAFALTDYNQARPWAKAIQEEVLERRMPPWGAVKGFGEFRDDQALTPEQIEVIADWVEGGAPEGDEPDLPRPAPASAVAAAAPVAPKPGPTREVAVTGDYKLLRPYVLKGIFPKQVPAKSSFQVTAQLPDASIVPLLWLEPFRPAFSHIFWFKSPLKLPAGTVIRGVPAGVTIALLAAP